MRPRIRTLKPELWQDERIGDLSHGARLLFIGLITMADDAGRLRELPATIIGHVFPYDDVTGPKLTRWLKEVAATGAVVRYEVEGRRYVAFRHWTKHQKVDKPSPSELPPPPEFSPNDSPNGSGNGRGSISEPFDDGSRPPARARRSDPVLSDPDPSGRGSVRSTVGALFDSWREACRHPDAKLTDDRRRKIEARLAEGYTAEQIGTAIQGAARAAFVNDSGKRFDDIELICRNGSKLESFIERASTSNVTPIAAAPSAPREPNKYDEAAARRTEQALNREAS